MHLTVDKATATQWAEQAQKTLQTAQKLCTNAQSSLHATTYQLTSHLPEILENAGDLYDSLRRQYEMITRIVEALRRSTRDQLLTRLQKQHSILLTPALVNLEEIVSQLSKTPVPSFLIESSENEESGIVGDSGSENKTLADFISTDSINLLKRNIDIYTANSIKIRQFLDKKLQESILDPVHDVIAKKYNKIVNLYDEIMPLQLDIKSVTTNVSPFDSNNWIGTLLKENASLENELVSILEMLTNHYDQCTQGVQVFKSGNSSGVNLEVLQNDAMELPEVLKELNTVYDIIVNNEARAQKFLNSNSPKIDTLISLILEQLDFYRMFKSKSIPEFMAIFTACEEILMKSPDSSEQVQTPIERFTDTVNQLVYHYTQFLNVYKSKYLLELHHEQYTYPRKFLAKLTKFLNEELYQLQVDERERRKAWLSKNGEFIPKEFKLQGEHNQPIISQIITEGLEDIQKEGEEAEHNIAQEKDLIDLIRSMRDLDERRY
ncbi:autophagy-related protein 17 [Scheffersomyces xylosifermentans]|uniref:autophagy-related protein 17 n=1 Tax=Scheffersomyces xylosifermentans TaxID=1304137 RepID=UPI00315CB6B4